MPYSIAWLLECQRPSGWQKLTLAGCPWLQRKSVHKTQVGYLADDLVAVSPGGVVMAHCRLGP